MSLQDKIQSHPSFTKTRLNSLYSNFERLKHLNPEGYEANLKAWEQLLLKFLRSGDFANVLSIPSTSPSLMQALSIPIYGSPQCLGLVLTELVKRDSLVPLSYYLVEDQSYSRIINNKFALTDYISAKKWISWTLKQIGIQGEFRATTTSSSSSLDGGLVPENYLNWDYTCEIGDRIGGLLYKKRPGNYSNRLYDGIEFQEYIQKLTKMSFTSIDYEIILKYLSRDVGLIAVKIDDEGEICIKLHDSLAKNNVTTLTISEDDMGIIKIKRQIQRLDQRNKNFEEKIEDLNDRIKKLIIPNKINDKSFKERAKYLLQTRKMFSDSYSKSSASLDQLTQILLRLDDASSNIDVFSSLACSSEILKTLNEKINQDEIDEVMMNLEENMQTTNEISDSLSNTLNTYESDSEVEIELAKLTSEYEHSVKPNVETKTSKNEELLTTLKNMHIDGSQHTIEDRTANKDEEKKMEKLYTS
ncbi:hypothetical protein CAAN1_01S02894 [[Candida] anglica]|uniref:Vacuolar-sorting protein SNF7 n=1 Tax=[Candida] anglica TaxID=148631 RepID=A0ABP0EJB4_9ASCO